MNRLLYAVGGCLLLAWVVRYLKTGLISGNRGRVTREDNPVLFWAMVSVSTIGGLLFLILSAALP